MFILKEGTTGGEGTPEETKRSIRDWLTAEGLIIRTKAEDKTVIDAAAEEVSTKRIKHFEDAIKENTGIAKLDNERHEDYLKRSITAKLGDITTLKAKIAEFESKGVDGNALAKELKERLETVQASYDKDKKELSEKIGSFEKERFMTKVEAQIRDSVAKIVPALNKMEPGVQKDLIDYRVLKFKTEYDVKEVEGMLAFYDKNTGKMVRKSNDGSPQSIDELIKPFFEDVIDKGYKATGTGAKGTPPPPGEMVKDKDGKVDWSQVKLPETVKSKEGLMKYITETYKWKNDSKEFGEAYKALDKPDLNLPFREPKAA